MERMVFADHPSTHLGAHLISQTYIIVNELFKMIKASELTAYMHDQPVLIPGFTGSG